MYTKAYNVSGLSKKLLKEELLPHGKSPLWREFHHVLHRRSIIYWSPGRKLEYLSRSLAASLSGNGGGQ
jgi:hypothetical protein